MSTVKESYEYSITGSGRLPIYCTTQLKGFVLPHRRALDLDEDARGPERLLRRDGQLSPDANWTGLLSPGKRADYGSSVPERDT